jgi:hypothetical protein
MEREGEKQTDSRGGGERGKGKKLSGPSEEEYLAVGPIIEQIWGQKNRRYNVRDKGRKPVTATDGAV